MLHWIRIENIAVIEALEIDFDVGLNLLTGETGAGKSILVDSLGLVLGARASADRLRTGAESGYVEAGFQLNQPDASLLERLEQASIPFDVNEKELVVRREIAATGRSKVIVNGRASAAGLLREIAPFLADVHGQGENLSLLKPEIALELLDHFGELAEDRLQVTAAYAEYSELDRRYTTLMDHLGRRSDQEQQLRFELGELDELAPREKEDEEITAERDLLAHTERRRELAQDAYASLYEREGDVLSSLSGIFRDLDELVELDPSLTKAFDQRGEVRSQLEDIALSLRDYHAAIEASPERLADLDTRLALLERAKKRYGGELSVVIARQIDIRSQLGELDASDEHREAALAARDDAAVGYWKAAQALSKKRTVVKKRLEKAVNKELPSLALDKARFQMSCEASANEKDRSLWTGQGIDRVRFLFSANPGEQLRPLDQVASGGELSRFMLALKVVSAQGEPPKTLVFDEVDTGISGRVSHAVGEKLREVAEHHQVVCVTHQPQIASFAATHYRVNKLESEGRTLTRVERLSDETRIDEIARMLAGATVTKSARAHAARLVAGQADE